MFAAGLWVGFLSGVLLCAGVWLAWELRRQDRRDY